MSQNGQTHFKNLAAFVGIIATNFELNQNLAN